MTNHPNDRFRQDTERSWRATDPAGHFPAQPEYREARHRRPTWAALNAQPADAVARRGRTTR
ncbi:DNA repair protein [Micromonospora sp. NBS 11-29]|uniref:DNA repair protein n=1 Tax=Micromonospora sp. NBS 11-29 TaxID=1960879 RepID=UPI000B772122|nr:DNA repair protein [Micromonospora sp. NBS 11-29]